MNNDYKPNITIKQIPTKKTFNNEQKKIKLKNSTVLDTYIYTCVYNIWEKEKNHNNYYQLYTNYNQLQIE